MVQEGMFENFKQFALAVVNLEHLISRGLKWGVWYNIATELYIYIYRLFTRWLILLLILTGFSLSYSPYAGGLGYAFMGNYRSYLDWSLKFFNSEVYYA